MKDVFQMVELNIQERKDESPRQMRTNGQVPGIIYGAKEPMKITLDGKELGKKYNDANYYTSVIHLKMGNKQEDVLAKDVQLHPVKDTIMHADFMRVSKDMKIRIRVPVKFINHEKSADLKHGGILNVITHTLEIKCSPYEIPSEFVYDLTGAASHESLTLDKLQMDERMVPVHPERDRVLATIVAPKAEKEETSEEEDGASEGSSESEKSS